MAKRPLDFGSINIVRTPAPAAAAVAVAPQSEATLVLPRREKLVPYPMRFSDTFLTEVREYYAALGDPGFNIQDLLRHISKVGLQALTSKQTEATHAEPAAE